MEKLLTIVVAAYNCDSLLSRCLNSLILPSVMDAVEVIVVNDGSEDATLSVAQEYEKRFPNYFIVVDKRNGNYGSVMNVALKMARGRYFRTLDADDYYDTSVFAQYVDELRSSQADLIVSERVEVKTKSHCAQHISIDDSVPTSCDLTIDNSFWKNKRNQALFYVMGMCYKTDVIRQSGLVWDEGIFYTDAEYCVWPLPYVKSVRFVSLPLYVYVQELDGQSTSLENRERYFDHYVHVAKRILQYFVIHQNNYSVYDLFVKFIVVDLLDNIYPTLYLHGLKNKSSIDEIESLVHTFPIINSKVENFHHFRDLHYVSAYRHNKLQYWMIRLDYIVRLTLGNILRKTKR